MASVSLLTRNVARRSFDGVARMSRLSHMGGGVRFSSYFTPGTLKIHTHRLFTVFILTNSLVFVAHEYVKVEGNVGTCGITDFAQAALGDIVFIDLPQIGDEFAKGESFGSVESVKAASDVYAPVSGTVVEVNQVLSDEPGLVNVQAEGSAWFVKIEMKDTNELQDLMHEQDYKIHCEKEGH